MFLASKSESQDKYTSRLHFTYFRGCERREILAKTGKPKFCYPLKNGRILGLVTRGIYDNKANLVSDEYIEAQNSAKAGPPRNHATSEELFGQPETYSRLLRSTNAMSKEVVATKYGLQPLPHNVNSTKLCMFNHQSQSPANRHEHDHAYPAAFKKILGRTNALNPHFLQYDHQGDPFFMSMRIKRRSLANLCAVIMLSINRNQMQTAFRGFALLVRTPNVHIKLLWNYALQLLVWKCAQKGKPELNEICVLLDWLLLKYSKPTRGSLGVTADELYYHRILFEFQRNRREALELAEGALTSPEYSKHPIYYGVCGMIQLKIALDSGERDMDMRKVQRTFKRCLQIGGVIPNNMKLRATEIGKFEDLESYPEVDVTPVGSEYTAGLKRAHQETLESNIDEAISTPSGVDGGDNNNNFDNLSQKNVAADGESSDSDSEGGEYGFVNSQSTQFFTQSQIGGEMGSDSDSEIDI